MRQCGVHQQLCPLSFWPRHSIDANLLIAQRGGSIVHPITQWKREFLSRRNLEYATGRPLYTYRVTTDEFAQLESVLKDRLATYLKIATLGDVARHMDFFPALFVLYAAEWWRRRYDGTGFSWDPILDSIGAPPEGWNQSQRSECVERGFQEWKLRLSDSHGLRFLGSIAFQGGLPMQLLGAARGNIGKVLSRVLILASSGTTDAREIQEWVKSLATYLPNSYRQAEVFVLLTEVVVTVLRLKEVAKLTNSEGAIERLDQAIPSWRDSFPLPVEDEQAKGMIEQLVRDAAGRIIKTVQHICAERRLEPNPDDSWSVRSDITLPENIDTSVLGSLFSVDGQTLPRMLTIRFIRNEKVSEISLRKLAGQDRYRIERRSLDSRDSSALGEHAMQLLTPSGHSLYGEIARGGALEDDLPWLFEEGGEGANSYPFARQGSGPLASIRGILCAPKDWEVTSEDGAVLEPTSRLADSSRLVWTIDGVVKVVADDGTCYKIKCGQAVAINDQFELRGHRIWDTFIYPDKGFRGTPRLFQISESGIEQPVQGFITWRASNARSHTEGGQLSGPVTALWPAQTDPKWRARVVLLPDTAGITVEHGETPNRGTLCFVHWGLLAVECETLDVKCRISSEGEKMSVALDYTGQGTPPEWLNFRGLWRGNASEARFRVPFPSRGIRIMDPCGQTLPDNTLLAINKITGYRMIGFLGNEVGAELRLGLHRGDQANPTDHIVTQLSTNSGLSGTEVRLIDFSDKIQRMLASADVLDAFVSIRLRLGSGESAILRIARYALELTRHSTLPELSLLQEEISRLSLADIESLPVLAIRLNSPGEEPIRLSQTYSEETPTGRWEFPVAALTPGPWLIFPGVDSPIMFRPMLWPIHPDELLENVASAERSELTSEVSVPIGLAAALGMPAESKRNEAMDTVISLLAHDFLNSDWSMVEHLAGLLGHLPLSTLDLWRRFTHSSLGMAALAMRFGNLPQGFSERFSNELPFVWELIPLDAWTGAMRSTIEQGNSWYGKEAAAVVIPAYLDKRIQTIASTCPSLRVLLEAARAIATGTINQELRLVQQGFMNQVFADQLFTGEDSRVQQLLRNNAEEEWPSGFSEEISIAKRNGGNNYFSKERFSFHDPVINIPIYLALCASDAFDFAVEVTEKSLRSIREIQSFDPDWFAEAFDLTIARCISSGAIKIH